jgi:hypothetical protein
MKILITILFLILSTNIFSQCNTNNTICQSGVAGPFNFGTGSGSVSTCLDWMGTSQFGYIVLYITQSGPLNLLINGNSNTGFLDVAVFNVPNGVAPCVAIQNNANQIGCNYATFSSGCSQFGNAFPCNSSIPAPNVVAGQVLMIVVEDWMNGPSSNFTLQLGPPPGAQTGPPNTTITPVGPFCTTSPQVQLQSVNMGGTWSGVGVTSSGIFNPSIAGPGTHTITYSLGNPPCNSSSTTTIVVNPPPVINVISTNVTCFGECDGVLEVNLIPGATYLYTGGQISGNGGLDVNILTGVCSGNYTVTVTLNGCQSTGTGVITQPPQVTVGNISHN